TPPVPPGRGGSPRCSLAPPRSGERLAPLVGTPLIDAEPVPSVERRGDLRLTCGETLLALGEGLPPGVPRADARADGTSHDGQEGELEWIDDHHGGMRAHVAPRWESGAESSPLTLA